MLKRRGNRLYYYKSVRTGGRVRTVYRGGGEVALLAAGLDALEAEQSAADRRELAEARRRADRADRRLDAASDLVGRAVAAELVAAGYHRPARKPWRRRRMTTPERQARVPLTRDEALDLLDRSKGGGREAMREVRAWLDAEGGPWVDLIGDPQRQTGITVTEQAGKLFSTPEAAAEMCKRKLARLRRELAGDNPTPLERLLADRVAISWFILADLERRLAWLHTQASVKPAWAELMERRVSHANRRFLASVKALADVRRLNPPASVLNLQVTAAAAAGIAAPAPTPEALDAP